VLYAEPRNLFVAAFIGSPAMNLVEASVEDDAVMFGGFRLPLDAGRRPAADVRRVVLGIRPETFEDAALAAAALPRVSVDVEVVEELGAETNAFFRVDAARVAAEAVTSEESDASLIAGDSTQLFTARLDPRSRVSSAGRVDLAVDPARFHFFDPESGAALVLRAAVHADSAPVPA
jgi:multiple sugar transport system ATP-binding protein